MTPGPHSFKKGDVSSQRELSSMTTIDLTKQVRADAIASIQRYFEENMPEPIGELPAGLLLNFFIGRGITKLFDSLTK